jgi:uncharacterized membrane protein YccC
MAPDTVSFRITRHTEDLAQTTRALSQRLVRIEQKLEALELQLLRLEEHATESEQSDPQELASLDNVERLLHDCRALLSLDAEATASTEDGSLSVAGDDPELAVA